MKLQFWGDLAGTGFGTVTMDLGRALLDAGHDVRFISQNDLGDLAEPFASRTFRVTPDLVDAELAVAYGETSLSLTPAAVLKLIRGELWQDGWRPEAALLLGDFYNVRRMVMADVETAKAFAAIPTFHYVPIEGVDLPRSLGVLWSIVSPVAMSEFGADQIERIIGVRPPVVYHGVDTAQFRPASPERPLRIGERVIRTRADAKAVFITHEHGALCPTPCAMPEISWSKARKMAEEQRWILRTDRFMPRKRYGSFLRALAPVIAQRPDTFLVIHCRSVDEGGELEDLFSKYPERLRARMIVTGFHDKIGGASRDILTALYQSADVYASCSAEGFGLTIAEAIACGTPAVGMDYSSVPEVIGPAGLLAPVDHLDDNEYGYAWATVNEPAFGSAVALLLDDEVKRRALGRLGPEHVRSTFSWAAAAGQFASLLPSMEAVA
jgi:glycosyltransferase involved in cell wall biosynthesis